MKRQIMVCTQETRNDAVVRGTGNGGGITTVQCMVIESRLRDGRINTT